MRFFPFIRRVRHPFFPKVPAIPAGSAAGDSTAIAGSFVELARAAARGARPKRAVYVLTRRGDWLTDGQRDELWNLFQVPVYALLLDSGGEVIGWECEAQNAMHFGNTCGYVCECGRPGARLMMAPSPSQAAD